MTGCGAITHNHKHAHTRCQEGVVRAAGARATAKTHTPRETKAETDKETQTQTVIQLDKKEIDSLT